MNPQFFSSIPSGSRYLAVTYCGLLSAWLTTRPRPEWS